MPSKKRSDNGDMAAKKSESPAKRAAEPPEDRQDNMEAVTSSVKRRKGLGVRVIGRRIYDSENGKTCHQCRQKTIDLMASCKETSGPKSCPQHFCAKCLLNRYGEKVSEVAQLSDWSCPKCRGECNCSICLKKRGCMPTGILAHTAKATGFNSVAELLKKQPDIAAERAALLEASSQQAGPKKLGLSTKNSAGSAQLCISQDTASPIKSLTKGTGSTTKKRKLVVNVDGQVEGPVADALLRPSPAKQNKTLLNAVTPTRQKSSALNGSIGVSLEGKKGKTTLAAKKTLDGFLVAKPKKTVMCDVASESLPALKSSNGSQEANETEQVLPVMSKKTKHVKKRVISVEAKDSKLVVSTSTAKVSKKSSKMTSHGSNGTVQVKAKAGVVPGIGGKASSQKIIKKKASVFGEENQQVPKNPSVELKKKKQGRKAGFKVFEENPIVVPQGEPLKTVAAMDFPAEAIGPALQFVEFCSAFKSVLGLRRGDAEAMLRELTKGRLARKGPNSLLVQLHVKLLQLMENESSELEVTQFSTGKRSWLSVLKKHLSERSCIFMALFRRDNADIQEKNIDTVTTEMNADVKDELADEGNVEKASSSGILKEDLRAIKDAIIGGPEAYENLGMYHKLQLLVILCDDSLETQSMRECVESANREYWETQKEKREDVLAARKEVKEARQKIKDAEAAKLLALGNITGPLTPAQQQTLLSRVQAETERAEAAASFEKEALSRMKKGRSDAVRTDALAVGDDGQIFYKLKGADEMNSVVVQTGVGDGGLHAPDSWRFYTKLEEDVLTKYLLQRARIARKKLLAEGGDEEKENRMPTSVVVS